MCGQRAVGEDKRLESARRRSRLERFAPTHDLAQHPRQQDLVAAPPPPKGPLQLQRLAMCVYLVPLVRGILPTTASGVPSNLGLPDIQDLSDARTMPSV